MPHLIERVRVQKKGKKASSSSHSVVSRQTIQQCRELHRTSWSTCANNEQVCKAIGLCGPTCMAVPKGTIRAQVCCSACRPSRLDCHTGQGETTSTMLCVISSAATLHGRLFLVYSRVGASMLHRPPPPGRKRFASLGLAVGALRAQVGDALALDAEVVACVKSAACTQ